MDRENKRRELRYVVTPKAVKDYDGDNTAVLTFNISATELDLLSMIQQTLQLVIVS